MTNDTTTLNGALQELGELMADNLTAQGVPSSASEGLTTLANKILDIQGGGSAVASISVTSSAQIIMSGGTSTLTFTAKDSNNTGVSGVSLDIYKGTSKVDTVTTGTGGTATYTYTGTGAGDVSFYATDGTMQSETYVVEDCFYYNATEQTFSGSSTTVYSAMKTGLEDIINENFSLEFDIMKVSGSDSGGLNIGAKSQYTPPSSANYRVFVGIDSNKFNLNNRTTSSSSSSGSSISSNTYYSMKLVKNSTTFTAYVGDTSFATKTVNWLGNYNEYDLYFIGWSSHNTKIKNIKLKPL